MDECLIKVINLNYETNELLIASFGCPDVFPEMLALSTVAMQVSCIRDFDALFPPLLHILIEFNYMT